MKMFDNFGDEVRIFKSFNGKFLVVIFKKDDLEIEMNFDLEKTKKIKEEIEEILEGM